MLPLERPRPSRLSSFASSPGLNLPRDRTGRVRAFRAPWEEAKAEGGEAAPQSTTNHLLPGEALHPTVKNSLWGHTRMWGTGFKCCGTEAVAPTHEKELDAEIEEMLASVVTMKPQVPQMAPFISLAFWEAFAWEGEETCGFLDRQAQAERTIDPTNVKASWLAHAKL